MERGEPPTCDLCGIVRPPAAAPRQRTADCLACHEFDDRYAAHTRHPLGAALQCLDCHRAPEGPEAAPPDVHSREYFLVHRPGGFPATPVAACLSCHPDQPRNQLAALLRTWEDSRGEMED